MLQTLWHFLSSFLPRAECQDSREGIDHGVRGTQAPARGDQMSTFLGKQNGRAEATEKRPTILLVVGPAEQFPKVTAPSRELKKKNPVWYWRNVMKKATNLVQDVCHQ